MTATLADQAQAVSTRRQMLRTRARWSEWCAESGMDPALASSLVAAIEAWHAAGSAPATIRNRVAWIRPLLVDGASVELARTLRGLSRARATPRPVGWTLAEVRGLADEAEGAVDPSVRVLLRGLILWAFWGAFRVNELLSLRCSDVTIEARGLGLEVQIRRSKTDQEGRGRRVLLPAQADAYCPVRAWARWEEYARARGVDRSSEAPAWAMVHGSRAGARIVERTASRYLRDLVARTRVRPAGWHALRRAHVTAALDAGASDIGVMQQTGHASPDTVAKYYRAGDWSLNSALKIRLE